MHARTVLEEGLAVASCFGSLPRRQLRKKEFTLVEAAMYFDVNPRTLAAAIKRSEREIERTADNRGRPRALTDKEVHPRPPLPADGTVENTDRLARIHREERKARKDTETQTGGDSRWSLCRSRYALAGVGEAHQEAGSEVGPGVRVLQLRRPEAALQAGVLCGHGRERPQAAGRGARQTVRFHEVGVCRLAVQWSRS